MEEIQIDGAGEGWEEGMWLEVKGTGLGGVYVIFPNSISRTFIRGFEITNRRTK